MLLLVVELMLGPGNWPLMRMTCLGTPRGETVPYETFHVKNKYGSSACTAAGPRRQRNTRSASRLPPMIGGCSPDLLLSFPATRARAKATSYGPLTGDGKDKEVYSVCRRGGWRGRME
ncbi:unnamed protein product, partial [Musa hybrid cultivar]